MASDGSAAYIDDQGSRTVVGWQLMILQTMWCVTVSKWNIRYEHQDNHWPSLAWSDSYLSKKCFLVFSLQYVTCFHQQFLHLEAGDTIDLRVGTISYRKVQYFYEFSVLISFTSSPQECGYNFVHQSASSSLWRLKRRTWIWLIHIQVYIYKVADAMVMYLSLTLMPWLNITIRIGVILILQLSICSELG